MPISFHYQAPSFRLKHKKRITDWILAVAYIEKKIIEKVDFVFCTDQYLLQLNKKFLSHNTFTDIITFDYSAGKEIYAEVYISIERVKENEKKFNTSFDHELHRVMIHGILHCAGYKDKNVKDREKMRRKEYICLRLLSDME